MVKSEETLSKELDELIERNYYSEEWELRSAAQVYYDALDEPERAVFDRMFFDRIKADPSVSNVSISSSFRIPDLGPVLAAELNRHKKASYASRNLMYGLKPYRDDASFAAVERFVDSEQEIEALRLLGHMNFLRALPHIRRALKKDALLEICLHIFQDRKRDVGLETLIADMAMLIKGREGYYRRRLEAMFGIKKGAHAPFDEREVSRIITEI